MHKMPILPTSTNYSLMPLLLDKIVVNKIFL